MVYDCIPFFNELDILKPRMQIMAPYVDFFVIEEASVTFSGEPKRMIFAENRRLFAEFEDKIRYVAVEDSPMEGVTTHERDKYQKNQLIRALSNCKPEDIIIFSDVDEIPNPETLVRVMDRFEEGKNLSSGAADVLLLSKYGRSFGKSFVHYGGISGCGKKTVAWHEDMPVCGYSRSGDRVFAGGVPQRKKERAGS